MRWFPNLFSHPSDDLSAQAPLLARSELNNDLPTINVAPPQTSCNSSSFWINSEFTWNFLKSLPTTSYGLTMQIMEIAELESDYVDIRLSNVALAISIPLAILFAAGEAGCHYAESKKISGSNELDGSDGPLPSLTMFQRLLIASHYLSDIYSDVGMLYGMLNAGLNINEASSMSRIAAHVGLTAASMWGNFQEVRNASDSLRELNAAEQAQRQRATSNV